MSGVGAKRPRELEAGETETPPAKRSRRRAESADLEGSRPHPTYPHLLATPVGEVYSTKHHAVPLRVGKHNHRDGRWYVSVGAKTLARARLVLEAWLGEPLGADQADHINGEIHDDRPVNLQRMSGLENTRKAFRDNVADWIGRRTASLKASEPPLLPGEEWRDVDVAGRTVGVSSLGRVRLKSGKSHRFTHGTLHKKARRVTICAAGMRVKLYVHRLVAAAFLALAPTPAHTVDHIDSNPLNNAAANLRWATPREQMIYAIGRGVLATSADGTVTRFACAVDAATACGVTPPTMLRYCSRGHTHGGRVWRFEAT